MRTVKLFFSLLAVLSLSAAANRACADQPQKMYVRFAESEMKRFPEAWQLDYGKRLFFGYPQGLGCSAFLKVFQATSDKRYYDYVVQWAESVINTDGSIVLYNMADYNIDFINAGKVLFDIYLTTGEQRYKTAMDILIGQLKKQPKTHDGGYWHKLIYQHQIWLDGVYMASPFMARYGAEFNCPQWIDEAVNQCLICARHTYDIRTGLYRHAWDESRNQRWADKNTGQSANFWGRSIGWYFMALVDVMDFVPESHPQREEMILTIQGLARALANYQDESGLWYQVVDMGDREGNYLEASASSMFMYSYAKAVNRGYIDQLYRQVALKAFDGLTEKLIVEQSDGSLSMTNCCAVAGLGATSRRDGSFEYYISEPIRDNDAKATAPFIMGCIELDK